MKSPVIPETYEEWRHCIVVECGIELTPRYIEKTISALQDNSEYYTQQFIRKYGSLHHQRVLSWFMQEAKLVS